MRQASRLRGGGSAYPSVQTLKHGESLDMQEVGNYLCDTCGTNAEPAGRATKHGRRADRIRPGWERF